MPSTALEFLKTVLPDQGFYCLAKPVVFDGKQTYKHQVFDSVEQLAQAAKYASDSEVDVFYAVGSLKERKVWNEKKQKHQVRTHANMSHFKSLFVDLDCGATNDFADQATALKALKEFCATSGFPKSTFVLASGGGLHCYWSFDKSIEAQDWLKIANRFKAICLHFKFKADPVCISDMARVLRVPETNNWKYKDNPRAVKVLFAGDVYPVIDIVKSVKQICESNKIKAEAHTKVPAQAGGIAWPEGLNNLEIHREYDAELIYDRCAQMARARDVGGTIGHGMRSCVVSVLKLTKQADYSVLLKDDPDPERVQAQTEEFLQNSISDNPSTCARFDSFNVGGCDNCKHKGKVKSPCVLGTKLLSTFESTSESDPFKPIEPKFDVTQEVVKPKPIIVDEETEVVSDSDDSQPKDDSVEYQISPTGVAYRFVDVGNKKYRVFQPPQPYVVSGTRITALLADASGDEKFTVVSDSLIFPIEVCRGDQPGQATVRLYLKGGVDAGIVVEVPLVNVTSLDSLRKTLASNGIVPLGNEKSTVLHSYMSAYIRHLQSMVKTSESHGSLGWDSDDMTHFVTPTGRYDREGNFTQGNTSDTIRNAMSNFKTKGTLDEWKIAINAYNRPGYEDYQFGHLVGYGSLVFPFSGDSGAVVSMVGATGSGKSTVLESINTMFGPPKSYLTRQDTVNAQMNRLGIYKNYPVTYDEISNIAPELLSDFIYSVSQGRSKLRLNQDSTEKSLGNSTWQLILACTTNHNLVDRMATYKADASAEAVRVFEFYIHRRDEMTTSEAREVFDKMSSNYGHAGDIFIKEMIKNADRVKALYKDIFLQVEKAANATQKERFWLSTIASTITGGIIAKKLGLHDFDMPAVLAWSIKQILNMRNVIDENVSTPQGMLVEFLNAITNRTLVLGGGVDEKGKLAAMYPLYEPTDAIWARLEKDKNVMFVDQKKIRDFLSNSGADYNTVKKVLLSSKIVTDTACNKVLSKDSQKTRTGNTRCWRINLNHQDMYGASLSIVSSTVGRLEGDKAV